jgi:hypothetical protein
MSSQSQPLASLRKGYEVYLRTWSKSATARHDSSEGEKNHEEISLFRTSNSTVGIRNCHRRQAHQTAPATSGDFYASSAGILAVAVHYRAQIARRLRRLVWGAVGQSLFFQESKWHELALIRR